MNIGTAVIEKENSKTTGNSVNTAESFVTAITCIEQPTIKIV